MRVPMPRPSLLLAVLALLALLPDLGAPRAQAAGGDGTLTIGIGQFAATLHPGIEPSTAKSVVMGMAHRPITVHDPDWRPACMLCTTLPTLENGGAVRETAPDGFDGIAVTYTLQPQAAWGDGTPVTVDDVILAWEIGRHPASPFASIELYRQIHTIDRIDDKTFTLHHDRVVFDYNLINDLRVLPAHLERPVFEADPAEYRNRTLYNTDPTHPGLYFGPYRVTEVVSGARVVLELNPTWHGTAPSFDRIVVRTIENTAALEANLLSGAIDMIAGENGVTLDQALAFEARHGDDYQVLFQEGLIYEHIDLNHDNPLLADRRIRQGLLHALDRGLLVEQLFQGRQPVAHTSVSALDWVYDPDVPTYAHDPERAAALFEAAGFDRIVGGIRHHADGTPLRLSLMTTAGNRTRELVQQVLQAQWREAGVDIVIDNEPARVLFGGTLSRREFDAMAMFAWVSSPENVPRTILHSSSIPTPENNWAGQNYLGYVNPEMDRLIERTETELDPEQRVALWHRIQAIYAEDLPALPLYFRANAFILPPWLEGVVPTGHQHGTSFHVEHWRRADG